MKRPSFQFYPGDWLNDAALRMVSVEARGLWIEMICIMHQGSEYGYLKVNHKVILPNDLSRMCGASISKVNKWISELKEAGVCSISESNCIFSRRMIRDEEIRKTRAAGGVLGGNPALKGSGKVVDKVNHQPNLQPTPSSSSSSSSSSSKEESNVSQKSADTCPHNEIIKLYHENLPTLPNVRVWTESRKRLLKARWHEDEERKNLDWWARYFKYVSTIPFLLGENQRGWQADIEFILTLKNFVKIIEGGFEGNKNA